MPRTCVSHHLDAGDFLHVTDMVREAGALPAGSWIIDVTIRLGGKERVLVCSKTDVVVEDVQGGPAEKKINEFTRVESGAGADDKETAGNLDLGVIRDLSAC